MKRDFSLRPFLLPLLLVVAALAWRVAKLKFGAPELFSNFSPWMALAFAGTLLMPRSLSWWVCPALLLGCDLAVGSSSIADMWLVYACYGLAAFAGSTLRSHPSVTSALGGTLLSSAAFYVITNTQAWFTSPVYAKSFAGWMQALTLGNPAYPPTWAFGLSSLLSDASFALLLVVAYNGEAIARRLQALPLLTSRHQLAAH